MEDDEVNMEQKNAAQNSSNQPQNEDSPDLTYLPGEDPNLHGPSVSTGITLSDMDHLYEVPLSSIHSQGIKEYYIDPFFEQINTTHPGHGFSLDIK